MSAAITPSALSKTCRSRLRRDAGGARTQRRGQDHALANPDALNRAKPCRSAENPDPGERLALILVDQNPELAMRICDWVMVMECGQVVVAGSSATLSNDPSFLDLLVV